MTLSDVYKLLLCKIVDGQKHARGLDGSIERIMRRCVGFCELNMERQGFVPPTLVIVGKSDFTIVDVADFFDTGERRTAFGQGMRDICKDTACPFIATIMLSEAWTLHIAPGEQAAMRRVIEDNEGLHGLDDTQDAVLITMQSRTNNRVHIYPVVRRSHGRSMTAPRRCENVRNAGVLMDWFTPIGETTES